MKYALSSKINIIPSYNDFNSKLNQFCIHFRAQIAKFAPQNRYRKNNKIRTTFFEVLDSILAPLDPQKSSKKIEKKRPLAPPRSFGPFGGPQGSLLGSFWPVLGVSWGSFWGPFGLFWGCPGVPLLGSCLACFEGILGMCFGILFVLSSSSGAFVGAKLRRSHLG